ncbi:succinate dehydrogenase cytochrome b subunit [Cellulomonas dongxiuzhuiae]|uniref:Succinate dehydrogenase cytochrome b subunit n=2 Tax=Cellulomonas dongxiuzhuiae TaxID=2819979 RepID=A0ABX8GG47_9CELL|nr:succinate dehydrogenase cytochrome b subunit [Cellulomonas dongxiuzhuiae]QWC14621.1 succinate dehydrogenase cytochrome b subunit [Cellulomonas dongxiuzhuiae]
MAVPTSTRPGTDPVPAVERPATGPPPRPATWVLKAVMAVTGTVLVAFAVVHLVGNLKIFLGPEQLDGYAHWLHEDLLAPLVPHGWFIWVFRAVMLAALLAHVAAGVVLRHRARVARGPHRRRGLRGLRSFQARSMLATGTVLLLFVIFHVLDLTTGTRPAATDAFTPGQAYANIVSSFQRPAVAAFYVLAIGVLTLHLAHGLWSVVNDLGATGRRLRATGAAVAGVVGLLVLVGNLLIPVAVLTGVVA